PRPEGRLDLLHAERLGQRGRHLGAVEVTRRVGGGQVLADQEAVEAAHRGGVGGTAGGPVGAAGRGRAGPQRAEEPGQVVLAGGGRVVDPRRGQPARVAAQVAAGGGRGVGGHA